MVRRSGVGGHGLVLAFLAVAMAACGAFAAADVEVAGPDASVTDAMPDERDSSLPTDAGDAADARDAADGDAGELDAGPKRVFLTSTAKLGNLGSRSGADQICMGAAQQGSLLGKFVAWISVPNGTAPIDRLGAGPWHLVDRNRTLVFPDRASVTANGPLVAIDVDESGGVVTTNLRAWTGTLANGSPAGSTCKGFTDETGDFTGTVGALTNGLAWTGGGSVQCNLLSHLYCFEL